MKTVPQKTKIALLLLAMLGMMSNAAIITSITHFEYIFTDIKHIELLARLMVTLPSLVIAISSPFLGHLIHKGSILKSATLALLLFGIAGSAGLYLDGIYALLTSRLFLGIAIGAIMIISTTLVGFYFKGQTRHQFMGLQSAFISIGGIVFITSGGVLSDIDWRYPFGIYLIGVLVLPFVVANINEPNNSLQDEKEVVLDGSLFFVYFLAFVLMLVFYTLPTQMPFLMMNHFGASGTLTGLIISAAMASNALGALSFAKLKKHYTYSSIYLMGLFILALGFMAIGNINNVLLFFVTSPIMGFGGGLLMTATTAWMLDLTPQAKRTKASGYLTSAIFTGQFFSPIVFHPFVLYLGLQSFFITLGAMLLLVALSVSLYRKIV